MSTVFDWEDPSEETAGNVHYRRVRDNTPDSTTARVLDVIGIEPRDLVLIMPLFSVFGAVLGFLLGVLL